MHYRGLLELTLLGSAVIICACGGSESYKDRQAKLAEAQAASTIAMGKTEPPGSCQFIGAEQGKDPKIYAPFASMGANSDDALQNLRETALKRGANYVVVDWVAGPMAQGRLYACPPGALTAGPSGPMTCQPDCSPGYACVEGACVSACNPACTSGKQCGADRVCHDVSPGVGKQL